MSAIVAIGGGELKDLETLPIDRAIVKLAGKKHPKALFIPTASNDSVGYWEIFRGVYGKKLGCETDALFLIREKLSKKQMQEKILRLTLFMSVAATRSGCFEYGESLVLMCYWKKRTEKERSFLA